MTTKRKKQKQNIHESTKTNQLMLSATGVERKYLENLSPSSGRRVDRINTYRAGTHGSFKLLFSLIRANTHIQSKTKNLHYLDYEVIRGV
jgi:hypothetical protein